jgi:predicted RNA-binding protein with PUA-like domain
MATFLLKTEPGEYSFADLVRDKSTTWSGVSNNAALAAIRTMRKGDEAFIYHTGDEKSIVGLAKVTTAPYADPKQPGETALGEPKFAVLDLKPVRAAKTPVSLATIKADKRFKDFALVKQSRLSVMAVPPDLDKALRTMTGL